MQQTLLWFYCKKSPWAPRPSRTTIPISQRPSVLWPDPPQSSKTIGTPWTLRWWGSVQGWSIFKLKYVHHLCRPNATAHSGASRIVGTVRTGRPEKSCDSWWWCGAKPTAPVTCLCSWGRECMWKGEGEYGGNVPWGGVSVVWIAGHSLAGSESWRKRAEHRLSWLHKELPAGRRWVLVMSPFLKVKDSRR